MFGAWQAGVWRVLSAHLVPDMVAGVSIGSLNAWAIAGGCAPEELVRSWLEEECAVVGAIRPFRRPWGVLDGGALHDRIRRLWEHYRPRIPIGIVAARLPWLRGRLFRDAEISWRHLAASCAVPFCYPAIRIDGGLYIDGGILAALPLWAAAQMGPERIVAIHALPVNPSLLVRNSVRLIRAVTPGIPEVPPDLEVRMIVPSKPLGPLRHSAFWRRDRVERWIAQGERDAAVFLGL